MSLVFLPVTGQGPAVQQVAMSPFPGHQAPLCITGQATLQPAPHQFVISPPPAAAPVYERAIIQTATKRNSDDNSHLLAGSVDNGAKKIKTEHIDMTHVSKVVHLRSLPTDVTETEVIQLGMTYGRVTNVLMLKGKNQAFLEMEDEQTAADFVSGSELRPATIRDRIIFVQFSNHKELKTDNSPNQMKAQAALQAMQQAEGGGMNHVLRIVVENMLYPITIDILHTIFSKFGVVLKIITFSKNNQFQALLQMGDGIQSQTAKLSLDGQNIYNACCTLRIEFSKLTSLNVKYNNDKSRDYTRNDLPSGEPSLLGSGISGVLTGTSGLMAPSYTTQQIAAAIHQNQLATIASASSALQGIGTTMTGHSTIGGNAVAAQLAAIVGVNNAVLHVSNLNDEMVTPQVLFVLFGVYGDVIRVKILFQKQNSALVQMNDYTQAQLVIRYLHGVKLFGRSMQIVMSKHNQVQMPKEGQEMSKLTQDYTNSPLHRFKKPGSKNFQNIFPPSDVLHLSNIPPETTEEFLTDLFSRHATVQAFKFFAKDRRMALVKLSSIEEAVKCLVLQHNSKLSENNHLRVSFSKGHI